MPSAMQNENRFSRRSFLSTSAKGAAVVAAGASLFTGRSLRAQAPANQVVLTLMGAGGRGSDLARGFARLPGVVFKYVCEVNPACGAGLIRELEKSQGRAPQAIQDIRKALDDKEVQGVIVATAEHWHALATVWACQAGKDVYVEKNPSLTIWEGRKMIEAARKYNRVVQVGFQNRSAPYALTARDYLRSGKLGKVVHVKVYNLLSGGAWNPKLDPQPVPAGFDWDRWLGPAPEVPYCPARVYWYDWWDYCGGYFSGDASHQLDLIRLVLGDPPSPRSAVCIGGNYAFHSKRDVPEMQTVVYDYGDFTMTCESGTAFAHLRKSNSEERNGNKWPYWPSNCERIEIYGTKQLMYLGRHGVGWQVVEADGKVVAEDKGVHPDKWHQPNFIDCIRTRRAPNADIEQAHQSAILIHLGNLSYRVGQKQLEYDAQAERFSNSDQANQLLKPAYRKNYRVPDSV
jgi:predicted dehydrogenase